MRLSASDASFLYAETASGPMHISSIYVLDGEISHAELMKHMADRMHLIPAYRRKISFVPFNMGHPIWVDDEHFELSNHIIDHDLGEGRTLEEGIDYAVALNEPMLDRSRPLWMMHLIHGIPGKTLLLQETHHCLIDGASGIELTTIVYDLTPDAAPPEPPEQPWVPEPPPNPATLFSDSLRENVQSLSLPDVNDVLDPKVRETQQKLMARAMEIGGKFVTQPAITANFNASVVGPKRRARYLKKSFADIRTIRRKLGGTINDVVLSVISEGMARYLSGRNESVSGQRMRIMCPVNVRTEEQQGALGNQVSAIFPMLPAWPLAAHERLSSVVSEMDRIKSAHEAQAMTLVTEASAGVWPLAMAPTQLVGTPFDPSQLTASIDWPVAPNLGWRPPNPGINFVCTNVPGVQVPQYLCGREVTDTIGLLILTGNIGFSLTILSYNKQLFFNFICEPRLMPDLEALVAHVDDAFGELLELAIQQQESEKEKEHS